MVLFIRVAGASAAWEGMEAPRMTRREAGRTEVCILSLKLEVNG
jgi:hypothetical protein